MPEFAEVSTEKKKRSFVSAITLIISRRLSIHCGEVDKISSVILSPFSVSVVNSVSGRDKISCFRMSLNPAFNKGAHHVVSTFSALIDLSVCSPAGLRRCA